jgi:hypothetical protein
LVVHGRAVGPVRTASGVAVRSSGRGRRGCRRRGGRGGRGRGV